VKKFKNKLFYWLIGRNEIDLYWLKTYLPSKSIFVDVGANNGLYSFAANRLAARDIYAFEPNFEYHRRLREIGKKVHVFGVALSNEIGISRMKVPIISGKMVSTRGTLRTNYMEEHESSKRLFQVITTPLDSILGTVPVNFIKIDVEGFELEVLQGAKGIIERSRPFLLVEIELRHNGEKTHQVFDLLASLNYQVYYLNKNGKEISFNPKDIGKIQASKNNYINNFFFKPLLY
jgi:FkbM family methyltransferase